MTQAVLLMGPAHGRTYNLVPITHDDIFVPKDGSNDFNVGRPIPGKECHRYYHISMKFFGRTYAVYCYEKYDPHQLIEKLLGIEGENSIRVRGQDPA